MKIYQASEKEIDERLAIDKRRNARAFYRYFDPEEELPCGFYDLQDKIRDGLENEFWTNFDDGVDRSHLKPWKRRQNTFFHFPAELSNCEQIGIEMSHKILDDKLIGLIMSYLEKCPSRYSIVAAVYESMEGDKYFGRFVINLDEIAVEESLYEVWSKQVQLMGIES